MSEAFADRLALVRIALFLSSYFPLFLIIFVETGVVVMPFLPGDSLLFVVGTLCGAGLMDLPLALAVPLTVLASHRAIGRRLQRAKLLAVQRLRDARRGRAPPREGFGGG